MWTASRRPGPMSNPAAAGARGLLAVLVVALAPSGLAGQGDGGGGDADVGSTWVVFAGVASQGIHDPLASPLRYSGTGLLVGAGYDSRSEARSSQIRLSYVGSRLGSRLQSARGGFEETHQASVGVAWLREMAVVAHGRVPLAVGATVDAHLSYRTHWYDVREFGTRTENFGDLIVPLQLSGAWGVSLFEQTRLRHHVSIPVVSLVMRSPWTGLKYRPSLDLAGPGEVTGFDSEVSVRTVVRGRWRLGVHHRMSLLKYPDPLPLSWLLHRVAVELRIAR